MLKLLCLLISISFLISCKGIDEPKFTWCVMGNFEEITCFSPDNKETKLPLKKGLGFIMLSPDDIGLLKDHHKELHIEIDEFN